VDRIDHLRKPAALALAVAREAAALVMRELPSSRERKDVRHKTPTDLVTRTDHDAERLITAHIRSRFPDHAVLGEEGGTSATGPARPGGPRWIVDPIDGTSNFVHGVPWFAVSIAFEDAGVLQCGVVAVPPLDEFFVAERGRGAYQVLPGGGLARLRTSPIAALEHALVATGLPREPDRTWHVPTIPPVMMRALEVRVMGAAAVHLAYIAAGRLEAFWEPGLRPWDVAAGILLVEEAGGRVTDWDGRLLAMPGGRLLASNGALHDVMVAVLGGATGRVAGRARRGAPVAQRPRGRRVRAARSRRAPARRTPGRRRRP
jgi:myo-inositol-1(or 4)-monophosphatase